MSEETALLARLTRVLAGAATSAPLTDRLTRAVCEVLAMRGGSISIGYAPAERTVLCATDETARQLEELQDVLCEGPSLDAFRTRAPVLMRPDEPSRRWPLLQRTLAERGGALQLFSLPMRPDNELLGVVSLYRRADDDLDLDLDGAQFLANATGVAILGGFEGLASDSTDLVWSTRDRINQATGMVLAQLRVDQGDALAVLRAHAFAHGITLAEVADLVVERTLDFRDDGGARP